MATRTTMNVSLTPELEKFIESRVASGRYQTASEVVRDGLRLLEAREHHREESINSLRAKLGRGIEQADHGELIPGKQVFAEIRKHSARRRKGNA